MIEFENDPVWTPLNPKSGHASWAPEHRMSMVEARTCAVTGSPSWPIARWDAEALTWIIAPPAPVAEATGTILGWAVMNRYGTFRGMFSGEASKGQAYRRASILCNDERAYGPFRVLPIIDWVEACIPVPMNEEAL